MLFFGVVVMYNRKLLQFLGSSGKKTEGIFYKLVGRHLKNLGIRVERRANLKKKTWLYKANIYLKEIIVNMGLAKSDVTPVGLLAFIGSLSFVTAMLFTFWTGSGGLFIPVFCAVFYFTLVVFRFLSLTRYATREAEIMDTEDLIAMDIKGGVYNSIVRYRKSFHPNIRPYFEEFIDDIQNKGYGFRQAMMLLNDKLGPNFTDFAQKAIMYEENSDKEMDGIFSSIIELNRYKRTLRYDSDIKFKKLRAEFLISVIIISLYGLFSMWTDDFLSNFFRNTFFGKFLLIVDVVIVTSVLAYISSIKSKFL